MTKNGQVSVVEPLAATAEVVCDEVTVKFGEVVALSNVSVSFAPRQIHALVGQNGAGKTTLARVIAGLVTPTSGAVQVQGRPLALGEVASSRSAGIAMVHQSFALPPSMSVAEALEFGRSGRGRVFSKRGMRRRWQRYLDDMNVDVDVRSRISTLPVESMQAIEIARALSDQAKTLILDEPTAVLPPEAIERLFDRLRELRDRGVTIIIVMHKAKEVLAVAETITVLRAGVTTMVGAQTESLTEVQFSQAIMGDEPLMPLEAASNTVRKHPTQPILELQDVATPRSRSGPGLEAISLRVAPGEIVGVAGVEGNGQVALAEAIAGIRQISRGKLFVDGRDVGGEGARERRRRGIRIIPFDRNSEGLSLDTPIWQNMAVPELVSSRSFFFNPRSLRTKSAHALDTWGVRYSSVTQRAGELSGGNAQKVVLARECDEGMRLLVAAQPTRGLDLGAMAFVWESLRKASSAGAGVIVISSDLEDLMNISDRIVVVFGGQLRAEFFPPYQVRRIGAAMTGLQ